MRQIISLNGTWYGLPALSRPIAPEELGTPPGDDWQPIRVPSHWQTQTGFGTSDSVVYYKTSFAAPQRTSDQDVLLELQGVFHSAEIWLNKHFVGRHTTYYLPFVANITELLKPIDNVLYIKTQWPLPDQSYTGIGSFGDWTGKPRELHPAGIWRDVNLHIVDEIYIKDVQVETNLTAFDTANITLNVSCQAKAAGECVVDYALLPSNFSGEEIRGTTTRQTKKGENLFNIKFAVNKPQLWWPWERGEPHLYRLTVKTNFNSKVTDRYSTHVGIRKVGLHKGLLTINGQNIFLRGANYAPTDVHPGKVVRKDLERDVQYLLDANLNCLRVYDHVALPELYDICDENGILVIQDVAGNSRQSEKTVKPVIRALKAHPCICAWYLRPQSGTSYSGVIPNLLTTVSRKDSNLNSQLMECVWQEDSERPVFLHARRAPSRQLKYKSTAQGAGLSLITVDRKYNTLIAEYGLPSFPGTATMSRLGAARLMQELDWDRIATKLKANKRYFARHLPHEDYDLTSTYFMATQRHQAQVLKALHEFFRVQKYKPWAGCLLHYLVDCAPVVSNSVIDYWRRTKLGYHTSQSALQPVLIVADWPHPLYTQDDLLELKLYAINDTPTAFMASAALWQLQNPDGNVVARGRHIVDLMGDSVVPAGSVHYFFPADSRPGSYTLQLVLELPTREKIQNNYSIEVAGIDGNTLE